MPATRICIGRIAGAHGVRGLVKVRLFGDDPEALRAYGPLADEPGLRRFVVRAVRPAPGGAQATVLAEIDGVADRGAAEALRGTTLWVDRAALPATEDEDTFYHADLIGLRADLAAGGVLGQVRAVHDFGAGEMLEIVRDEGPSVMVPFTRAAVPEIDIAGGRLVVDPPAGLLDSPRRGGAGEEPPGDVSEDAEGQR